MKLRKAVAVAMGATALGLGQLPASAAPAWAVDRFKVCVDPDQCGREYAEGKITWGNRTAVMSVRVVDQGGGIVSAHFDAFAGSAKVDSEVLYGNDTFTIGDPNRRGGINRIRTQVCVTSTDGRFACSRQWNDIRD